MRRPPNVVPVAVVALLASVCLGGEVTMPDQAPASPRDLNTHHCMTPPATLDAWVTRAGDVRRRILVGAGLWPMPAKTPLKPIVTGRAVHDDFIVDNVAIETLPGFRLCGNLYRPRGKRGPFPAIANPHGHWSNGRLEVQADVEKAPPPPGKMGEGRANLPAIGVDLAREGFVVFAYDMVGYNDTDQASHHFAQGLDQWFAGVSLLGLQLWNSLRAVDYLCSLRDVDRSRIGVTGASGGGTQTFLLAAVDERVKASVPVNMVSASMQGGCLCENGPGLRVGTDNVEIAALAAPKPQLLIAATGDWTKNNPGEEWPAVRAVYSLFGAADRTECRQFNYGHNYNIESREAMLEWFARWLKPTRPGDAPHAPRERPAALDTKAMRVWREGVERPAGLASEKEIADAIRQRMDAALAKAWPKSVAGIGRFRNLMLPALRTSLGIDGADAPARRSARSGRAVLIVRPLGMLAGEADRIAQAARAEADDVQVIEIPTEAVDPQAWWDKFRSCYNAPPVGVAASAVAVRLTEMARSARRVDVIGLGAAGSAAIFGRAVSPAPGDLIADLNGLDPA
ncbi:MAG: hypothetical protein FJX72_16990, partial [Armatimonadetes bacterium]|nr:hypothetical protein [Armatimonadota bacterium]